MERAWATMLDTSPTLEGRSRVLPFWASSPKALTYCSAITSDTASAALPVLRASATFCRPSAVAFALSLIALASPAHHHHHHHHNGDQLPAGSNRNGVYPSTHLQREAPSLASWPRRLEWLQFADLPLCSPWPSSQLGGEVRGEGCTSMGSGQQLTFGADHLLPSLSLGNHLELHSAHRLQWWFDVTYTKPRQNNQVCCEQHDLPL